MLNRITMAVGYSLAAFLVAQLVPEQSATTQTAPHPAITAEAQQEINALRAQLDLFAERVDDVADQLQTNTDRLQRIEDAIVKLAQAKPTCPCGDNCKCPDGCPDSCPQAAQSPIIEPPKAPQDEPAKPKPVVVAKAAPVPVLQSSRVQTILANYRGADWTVRGEDTRSHLVRDHGFTDAELSGLSEAQLRRLHGAAHTNHWSYSGGSPATSGVTVHRAWSTDGRGNQASSIRYSQPRRVYYSNCPNGRCPIR